MADKVGRLLLSLLAVVSVARANPSAPAPEPPSVHSPSLAVPTILAQPQLQSDRIIVDTLITGPAELLQAAMRRSVPSRSADAGSVKQLRPAPAAYLIVLVGFALISLVRDRRFWLTALTTLVCASQVGIHAIPRLASNLRHSYSAAYDGAAAESIAAPQHFDKHNDARRHRHFSHRLSEKVASVLADRSRTDKNAYEIPAAVISLWFKQCDMALCLPRQAVHVNFPAGTHIIEHSGRAPPHIPHV